MEFIEKIKAHQEGKYDLAKELLELAQSDKSMVTTMVRTEHGVYRLYSYQRLWRNEKTYLYIAYWCRIMVRFMVLKSVLCSILRVSQEIFRL